MTRLNAGQAYVCRASGEGTHNFRLCDDEADVMAFYEETCGART